MPSVVFPTSWLVASLPMPGCGQETSLTMQPVLVRLEGFMNNKPIDLDRRLGPVSQHAIDLPPRRRSSRPLCSSGG